MESTRWYPDVLVMIFGMGSGSPKPSAFGTLRRVPSRKCHDEIDEVHQLMLKNTFVGLYMTNICLPLTLSLGALFAAYLLTLRHHPSPNDPPNVPSFFPWIGNALEFNSNPLELFEACRPVYPSIDGKIFVVISDMKTIHALQKNPSKAFTSDPLVLQIVTAVSGVRDESEFVLELAKTKVIPALKRGLAPPSLASPLGTAFDGELLLQIRSMLEPLHNKPFRLSDLVGRTIYFSTANALFGSRSLSDLQTYEDFQVLDANVPNLSSGLPFLGRQALPSRGRILGKFMSYLAPMWDEDSDQNIEPISSAIHKAICDLKSSQCSQRLAAAALLNILYGSITNLQYMVFWLLANLIVDEDAMQKVLQEIDDLDACDTTNVLDSSRTPLLESAIQESLRWSTRSNFFRIVNRDTEIQINGVSNVVRKGECILGNIRAVHYDPSIYTDPDTFKVDRYLDPETSPPKPMAWGGREQVWKGKHLALFQMRRFVIHLLRHYSVKAVTTNGKSPTRPGYKNLRIIALLSDVDDFYVAASPR